MIKINSTVVDGCGDNEYILSIPYSQRYLLHTYVEKSGQFFISQMGPALAIYIHIFDDQRGYFF